jgi:hypothetical protein
MVALAVLSSPEYEVPAPVLRAGAQWYVTTF